MKRRTKFSIIFIITFFVLITIAFIFAGRWTRNFQKLMETKGSIEYAKVHDVVVTETKDGIKDWEIYSAEAEYDTKKVVAVLSDIVGNYYKNGEVIMSFTAPKGSYNSETKKIILTNGVRVVGKDNIELTANQISWVTTEDKVYAEGNVIINKNDEAIALSNKASATTDFKFIELIKNSEIRVYKDNQKIRGI